MSSLSVSTSSVPPFVSCRSCSVVLPTALTTTTTRFLRAYSSATDSAARLILLGLDKLDPPNLTISKRRGSRKERVDRKSTRLNSSHDQISYAVFCLKKKK